MRYISDFIAGENDVAILFSHRLFIQMLKHWINSRFSQTVLQDPHLYTPTNCSNILSENYVFRIFFFVCAHEMRLPEPAPKTEWQNQMLIHFSSSSFHCRWWSKIWNLLMTEKFAYSSTFTLNKWHSSSGIGFTFRWWRKPHILWNQPRINVLFVYLLCSCSSNAQQINEKKKRNEAIQNAYYIVQVKQQQRKSNLLLHFRMIYSRHRHHIRTRKEDEFQCYGYYL